MVVSRDGKRKRKESPVARIVPPTPEKPLEPPKRSKVHAQRKFAQGQGTSASSAYLNYTTFSNPTPPKEQREPTELLPNERPNTEDFLTYLCFRGTPALPPNLDFFNPANRKSGGNATATATTSSSAPTTSSSASKKKAAADKKAKTDAQPQPSTSTPTTTKAKGKVDKKADCTAAKADEKEDVEKPKYMAFAVRKRAEQYPDVKVDKKKKKTRETVQALKKKYLDQRVAKLKSTSKQQQQQSPTGRCTRSNQVDTVEGAKHDDKSETDEEEEEKSVPTPKTTPAKKRGRPTTVKNVLASLKTKPDTDADVSSSKDSATAQSKSSKRKTGLRSAIITNYNDDIDSFLDEDVKTPPKKSPKLEKTPKSKQPPAEVVKDDVDKESQTSKATTAVVKKPKKSFPDKEETKAEPESSKSTPKKRATRLGNFKSPDSVDLFTTPEVSDDQPFNVPLSVNLEKSTPKVKALASPKPKPAAAKVKTKPTPEKKAKITPEKVIAHVGPGKLKINLDEFSSDDDEPLAFVRKIVKKKPILEPPAEQPIAKSPKIKKKLKKKKLDVEVGIPEVRPDSPKKLVDKKPIKSAKVDVTESPKVVKKAEVAEEPEPVKVNTDEKEVKTKKKKSKQPVDEKPEEVTKIEENEIKPEATTTPPPVKGKRGRKKKIAVISPPPPPPAVVQQPHTELEPFELKPEAATSQANTTDLSENETKITARPSRKTKEAATIYMELIGRRLNLRELSDDDASSLDSLELPNVRRMEQMEIECKAIAVKKDKEKATKKKKEKAEPVKEEENDEKAALQKSMESLKESESAPTAGSPIPTTQKKPKKITKKQQRELDATATTVEPLEKSFSESDEEPLAIKIQKKEPAPAKKTSPKQQRKTTTPPVKRGLKSPSPVKTLEKVEEVLPAQLPQTPPPLAKKTIVEESPTVAAKIIQETTPTAFLNRPPPTTPHTGEEFGSTKVQKSTPDSSAKHLNRTTDSTKHPVSFNKLLESPVTPTTSQKEPVITTPFSRQTKIEMPYEDDLLKTFIDDKSKPINLLSKQSSLLGNILPSAEESGKIFGIASITLAQSSGPLDTKCTLGKCGSVHKPSLGPAVLTESNLGGHLSARDRRKAKVNMTHEQIQKWLDETSWSPVPDDMPFEQDTYDSKTPLKPVRCVSPAPPQKDDEATSSSFKSLKIKEDKSNNSTKEKSSTPTLPVTKGPTLKATPVAIKIDKEEKPVPVDAPRIYEIFPTEKKDKFKGKSSPLPKQPINVPSPLPDANVPSKPDTEKGDSLSQDSTKTPEKKSKLSKILEKKVQPATTSKTAMTKLTPIPMPEIKTSTKASKPLVSEIKPLPKKVATPPPTTPVVAATTSQQAKDTLQLDRKPIYGRRPAVYKPTPTPPAAPTPPPKTKPVPKAKPVKPVAKYLVPVKQFGAFSPENEHSVYSFDKEDDALPVTTPFRQRKGGGKDNADDSGSGTTFQKPQSSNNTTPAKKPDQQEVSLTLSPEDHSKSASITVSGPTTGITNSATVASTSRKLLELGEMGGVSFSGSKMMVMDDNDSDGSEGHTFYIPLQGASTATGSKSEQLIQGVKVKLGTEGPEGPNQRVIMHAKLVTKAQMGTNTGPIPESMANVQEIVKTLMAGKELTSKSVPVGTVQPRFKSGHDEQPPASTSAGPTLSRMNSTSSLSSIKQQQKYKNEAAINPNNITAFPRRDDPAQMVEAPIFRPTDKEFQDPIEYFERIAPVAARFGICKIIPPDSFKPECKVSDEMRFTAYNQYVHKMLHRWGPSAKELAAIKKYLVTQSIELQTPPLIGGMEVDLPRLYHTVQELGGLKEVIEKKKWARVAEEMCIPKTAHDRCTKLDDIYCKYLLPYDTLSPAERQKLFDSVEADWAKREAKARRHADKCVESSSNNDSEDGDENDEDENSESEENSGEGDGDMECIMKGRSMALSQFFRIARNTMSIWFKSTEPSSAEIEAEFWRHVAVRDSHVCVHSGSIDSSGWGYGFPTPGPKTKGSPCAKHPWNLKVLTNNNSSILRSLGPVMGVTVPTLHVGMLFSACCWYRDPHGLPWIEYLHTGGSKIWYGIPDDQNHNFRAAVTNLVPTHCQNKTIWLPCDTMMIPPHMLTDRSVSLSRTEQKPGEFVMVFPRAYTSSVGTGYTVSESVYFASNMWLDTAKQDFEDIQNSCEPTMFSIEQLLFAIASDQRSNNDTLTQILPLLNEAYEKEKQARQALKDAGVTRNEKLTKDDNKAGKILKNTEEYECDLCRSNLYISMIKATTSDDANNKEEDSIYCLKHAIKYLNDNRLQAKRCRLAYNYNIDEIEKLIRQINDKLAGREPQHTKRKSGAKPSGSGTK